MFLEKILRKWIIILSAFFTDYS